MKLKRWQWVSITMGAMLSVAFLVVTHRQLQVQLARLSSEPMDSTPGVHLRKLSHTPQPQLAAPVGVPVRH